MRSSIWTIVGFISGALTILAATPNVKKDDDCRLYRVSQKTATAFVLKPPVLEQAKCEAFCPAPIAPSVTEVSQDEPRAEEEPVVRRHHRRRWRHWRRYR